ncbi:MAG TPA: sulfhydrogenase subunit delta [Gammaproteobacteria bacterium]|nr:sulfhydrogenase subunit delta [Gammaproteobacteria bacterium]
MTQAKPKVAVYKFTSCDGCQLAFLNAGERLLQLSELVELVHFVEAGPVNPEAEVDIAFVEGSVTTADDVTRIQRIRAHSRHLITIGACAVAGGIQALRNMAKVEDWVAAVYASPEHIHTLERSTPIATHVNVDLELWGCPVNTAQVLAAVRALLFGVMPVVTRDSLCLECKRRARVCVLVAQGQACMGPVTGTGCGALCPGFERECYGCYGPAENPNPTGLAQRFSGLGLMPGAIARRFLTINNAAPEFVRAAREAQDGG